MTANNRNLVDLLVEKTGLKQAEVREKLQLFKDRVWQEIEKEGACTVDDLGTFTLENNDLVFVADESLATEINHKYAGMKPIELIGSFKGVTESVATDATEESKRGDQSLSDVEEYREEMTLEEEKPETAEIKDTEIEDTKEKEKEQEVKKEIASEISQPKHKSPAPVTEAGNTQDESGRVKTTAAPLSNKIPADRAKSTRQNRKQEAEDPLGKILVAAVIVIALVIAGWMVYDLGYLANSSGDNTDSGTNSVTAQNMSAAGGETEKPEDNKAAADSVIKGDISGSAEQNDRKSLSNVSNIAEASRQSIYGLRGGASPRAEDGYTIVVHSLRDEAKVRRLNEELQREGYRTVISRASLMDTTFWRLGLGQFKTIKDATEASKTLPDPYKSNHFIKRIQ